MQSIQSSDQSSLVAFGRINYAAVLKLIKSQVHTQQNLSGGKKPASLYSNSEEHSCL